MAKQSITKNYILNTAYQMLNLIAPLITAPYIARVLGAEGVGIYSYTTSVVAFFSIFAVLGTTTYGQQVIAQIRDDIPNRSKVFWEIEFLSLLTTLISIVLWVCLFTFNAEYKNYYIILTIELLAVGFDISWFYSGLERFSCIVYHNIVIKVVSIVLLFLLVKTESDVGVYIAILAISKLLGNVCSWIALPWFVQKVSLCEVKLGHHFKETLVYFIPTIAASVYSYLDKLMIQWFTDSNAENGYYEQANKIIRIAYTMIISVNTVMASRMAYLFAQKKEEEIKIKLETAMAFILTIGIACVFGIIAIAPNFVPWFYGEGYEAVIVLLIAGSPLVIILSIHNFLAAQYLVPSGQRIRSTKGVFVGAGVNFVCNLALIPHLQSMGAVIGTLLAELSVCAVYFWMSKEYVPMGWMFKYLPRQLFAGSVMLLVLRWMGQSSSGNIMLTFVQVIVGVVIYFVILFLTKEKFVISVMERVRHKLSSK